MLNHPLRSMFYLLVLAALGAQAEAPPTAQRIADMSSDRAVHQATLLASGEVLVSGGCHDGCQIKLASAELFDPQRNVFSVVAPMSTPRAGHSATALRDGRVLLAGGWSKAGVTASAEVYDPASRRFVTVDDMASPRGCHASVALQDGRVLLLGGETRIGASLASSELFDPHNTRFEHGPRLQEARCSHAAVRLADGRVLISGGHRGRGEVLRSAELFDPRSGSFEAVADMQQARHKHAAVLLADGRVLIVGGSNQHDYAGRLASSELFDPATGQFQPGPDLGQARHKLADAVTRLASGDVLVAGDGRYELYHASSGRFRTLEVGPSAEAMFATATALADGRVLVLGGYDARIRSSAQAWMVDPAR